MTLGLLEQIVKENNIPNDAKLMSDSGWECDATNMDGIFYNKGTNTLVFTQGVYDGDYYDKPGTEWKKIYSKQEDK